MSREAQIVAAKKYIARKCGQGSACACEKGKRVMVAERMSILAAGSVADLMSFKVDRDHPNQLPFKGVLLVLNQSSTKPPHGSRGHRIYVPTRVAEKHLIGLTGMAINYDADDLDSHETRHKVGVITKAWIKDDKVWVKGIIWKKDFPEAVAKLSGRSDLGMSMELADVYVRDENEDVWHLEGFEFTGATILKKSAAAYYSTELSATSDRKNTVLAAIAAAASGKQSKGEVMSKTVAKARVAAASNSGGNATLLVGALKSAFGEAIAPLVTEIRASNERGAKLSEDLEELKGLHLIQAAAHEDEDEDDDDDAAMAAGKEEDEEEDDDDMAAAKKKEEEADEDDDDDADEDDDLDAMESLGKVSIEEEPAEVNSKGGDKNQGDKNTVTDPPTQKEKVPGNIAKKRLSSSGMKSAASIQAAAVMIQTMQARMDKLRRNNRQLTKAVSDIQAAAKRQMKKMRTEIDTLKAQAEKHAETIDRRSKALPVEIRNLMAKAGVEPRDIQAGAAEKLTVGAVDQVFNVLASEGVTIEPVKRAEYKNRMVELGLMENGEERYAG